MERENFLGIEFCLWVFVLAEFCAVIDPHT
jgi:hypothetical protein